MNSQTRRKTVIGALTLLVLGPAWSAAQTTDPVDPEVAPTIRLGPVFLTPSFALRDIGVDSNVLNDSEAPKSDITATISSGVEAALNLRDTLFTAGTAANYVYFHEFSDQRYIDRTLSTSYMVPLDRLRFTLSGTRLRTRERLNDEIDVRARRTRSNVDLDVDVSLTARTSIVGSVGREKERFDEGETFQGVELEDTLNRVTDVVTSGVRFSLTPLTSVTTEVEIARDRFPLSPERDADSIRLAPLFEFDPDALLRGTASAGYRVFNTPNLDVPNYSGFVAAITVGYTLLGITTLDFSFNRDVQYSFDGVEPFYISTRNTLDIRQRLLGPVDLLIEVGRSRFDYQPLESASTDPRFDTVTSYGAGFRVQIGQNAGFEILAGSSTRDSTSIRGEGYDRTRIVASIDLGL